MTQRKVIVRGATNQALDELDATDIPDLSATYEAAGATSAHTGDTSDAHDASAISFTPAGTIAATDVQAAIEEVAAEAGGAPTNADYLVGTANGGLSAEIVVGTTPGGELGGTWASPTVDATHSGSSHAGVVSTHEAAADPHTGYVLESLLDAKGDLIAASADNTPAKVTVGANDTILMADSTAGAGLKWVAPATPSTQAFGDAAAEGTADTFTRGDHKHGMPTSTGTKITALSSATPLTTDVVPYVSDPAGTPVTKKTTVANLLSPITGIDYLVGTASGNLSAEIAVGTTPGGELGGTWASPTVDQDHAGEYSGGGTTFAVDNTNKDILSVALASLAAGDVLTGEAYVLYLNNSGGARTISTILDLGGQSVTVSDGATIGASATNRSTIKLRFSLWIESSSSVHMFIEQLRGGPAAANTSATSAGLSSIRDSWNTSGSNLTGSQTLAVKIVSSAATTTQTAYVMGWRVRRAT